MRPTERRDPLLARWSFLLTLPKFQRRHTPFQVQQSGMLRETSRTDCNDTASRLCTGVEVNEVGNPRPAHITVVGGADFECIGRVMVAEMRFDVAYIRIRKCF